MAHPFEVRKEIELDASPEDIWEAIATGKGIDGWFLGVGNEVEPREGGRVLLDFGDAGSGESTVTVWDPPRHFAHKGDAAPDGSLHAMEYIVEGRGGRTLVRLVHSGFLGGDWETEYDALSEGDFMYLHQLGQYVKYFRGRRPILISLWRPDEPDRERVLSAFGKALGLTAEAQEGDRVQAAPRGLPPIDGVVDFRSRGIIGVRTDDALYRFVHTPQKVAFLGHHIYRDGIDAEATRQAWQGWLDAAFA